MRRFFLICISLAAAICDFDVDDSVFLITSPAHRNASRVAIQALMRDQNLTGLCDNNRVVQLAAVGGVSRWKRNGSLFLLNGDGDLIHEYSPGAVESDVLMCIICALLTFIVAKSKADGAFC